MFQDLPVPWFLAPKDDRHVDMDDGCDHDHEHKNERDCVCVFAFLDFFFYNVGIDSNSEIILVASHNCTKLFTC